MHRSFLYLSALLVCLLFLTAAEAWPGFSWDEWSKLPGVEKPDIESPQAGYPKLLPLLKNTPDDKREFPAVILWNKKRRDIELRVTKMTGKASELMYDEEPAKLLDEEFVGEYTRQHVEIPGEKGDRIPAYVLIPKKPAARPMPAMIVLHQTQAAGKDEPCGISGDPEMAFADELAKRGFLCVVPDAIGFGERIPEGGQPYDGAMDFFNRHPNWSFFGKMNFEVGRVAFTRAAGMRSTKSASVLSATRTVRMGLLWAPRSTRTSAWSSPAAGSLPSARTRIPSVGAI